MSQAAYINDLTRGRIFPQVLKFSTPFMLANLLLTVYNLVDMVIVGRFCGSVGLSAVSVGGDLMHLFTFLSMGLCSAAQVIISQYVGKKDFDALKHFIGTFITCLLILGITVTIAGLFITNPLLNLLNTPEEAYSEARVYSLIAFAGMIFTYGYNAVSSILRGMGDSRHPLIFVGIAAVTNVILDIVFVAVLNMGAGGAALGTIISQALSVIISIVFLMRHKETFHMDFTVSCFVPGKKDLQAIIKLGIPMTIQSVAVHLSMLVVASYINSYGLAVSAANGIGSKLTTVIYMVTSACATAGSSMVGQNIGAEKRDRIPGILGAISVITFSYCILLSVVIILFPEEVFALFDDTPDVLAIAKIYAPICVVNFMGAATRSPSTALINGIGLSRLNFIMGIMDGVVGRIFLAIFLGVHCDMGITGFWLGSAIAGYMFFIVALPYFISGKWKTQKGIVA